VEGKMSINQFANESMMKEKSMLSMSCFRFSIDILLGITVAIALFCSLSVKAYGQGKTDDLCRTVPGDEVAKTTGGKIIETKSLEGRCVYIVGFEKANPPSRAFVIYRHDAGDYDGLKDAMGEKIKPVRKIGDEAVGSFDSESNRYWLLVVKRKQVAFQVSGDNEDLVQKVADVTLKYLVH